MGRALPSLAVVLLLLAAGCGGGAAAVRTAPPQQQGPGGSALTRPTPAPDLALHDQDGKLVRLSALRGKLVVVAFLYTSCPDVCPLIASNLNTALRQLGPERSGMRVLAVSIDPKGDTPAAVRRYVAAHRLLPEFRYLTGTKAELAKVWKAYHVAVVSNEAGTVVGHASYEVLVDRGGTERVLYDSSVTAEDLLHDVAAVESR